MHVQKKSGNLLNAPRTRKLKEKSISANKTTRVKSVELKW